MTRLGLALFAALLGADALWTMVNGASPLWLGPLTLPARRLQLEVALASLASAGALWAHGRQSGRMPGSALVGLLSLAAFLANTRLIASADTSATAALPFVVVREGTFALDSATYLADRTDPGGSYYLQESRGRTVSMYPVATGLLALPFYLPAALGRFNPASDSASDLQKLAAAGLSSMGVAFLFMAMRKLVPGPAALTAAGAYVAGTAVSPILGQALWQHTGAAFALSVGVWALCDVRVPFRAVVLGAAAGVATAARAPDLILGAGLLAALAMESRREGLLACACASVPLGLLAAYNTWAFGLPWATGYGAHAAEAWTAPFLEGATGTLLSPGRGLFVVSPMLVFGLGPLFRQWPALATSAALYWLLMANWKWWDGAFSAGPRMLSDTLPFLGVGLALAFAGAKRSRFLGATVAWSITVNALLTYAYPSPRTKALVWTMTEGPWSPRAFPPVGFALGWVNPKIP